MSMERDEHGEAHPAPMEAGYYNEHAQHQAGGGVNGLPMIDRAFALLAIDGPVTIADYGCAQGRNSLAPVARALTHVRRARGDVPVTVIHTDQPDNDFATLFGLLHDDPASYLRHDSNIFAAAVGRSFYEQVLPPGSVDFGWSSFATHWLSTPPVAEADHLWPRMANPAVTARFAAQAAIDWRTFLACRARELKPGGTLVVLQPSLAEGTTSTFPELMGFAQAELEGMAEEGVITPAERGRMTILIYERTPDDVRAPFAEGMFEGLSLVEDADYALQDPFWPAYQASGDAEALADGHLGFFRAPFFPSLIAALDPERDAAFRAAFAAQLSAGLKRRMVASPLPLLAPSAIHVGLFRKAA
ncbi:hypothetical protein ABLE93_13990 [Xanthobacter sp. KR7-65]|uniref:hypothetical protein n=1 Tax=Xanthobacter sp. KR7-65 TaxID=3156612 RepID=UPI0032B61C12